MFSVSKCFRDAIAMQESLQIEQLPYTLILCTLSTLIAVSALTTCAGTHRVT